MGPVRRLYLTIIDSISLLQRRLLNRRTMRGQRQRRRQTRLGRVLNVVQFETSGVYRRLDGLDEIEIWLRSHHPDIDDRCEYLISILETERLFLHQLINACEKADHYFMVWSGVRARQRSR
ncbi:hypothetical protein ACRYJU_04640 [Alloalcanivorax xenomutans]|uniref:Uncharacterized protein n=1 Tax=Alcanivorax xiamenensis TaxID=1177156 RepID=A0ABQ6Y579_9GAMM|nr:hypothetical protein [Alcanivorax xiamenensis]KAF0804386.1 hypothetical protein A6D6_03123 [Alcanivorax xiamenensis]